MPRSWPSFKRPALNPRIHTGAVQHRQSCSPASLLLSKPLDPEACLLLSLRLPPEFRQVVRAARSNPGQAGVCHICASLHVYSELMIDGFVEQSAKAVHFFLVQALAERLDQVWREEFYGDLCGLFPKDEQIARERQNLEEKLAKLSTAKAQPSFNVF